MAGVHTRSAVPPETLVVVVPQGLTEVTSRRSSQPGGVSEHSAVSSTELPHSDTTERGRTLSLDLRDYPHLVPDVRGVVWQGLKTAVFSRVRFPLGVGNRSGIEMQGGRPEGERGEMSVTTGAEMAGVIFGRRRAFRVFPPANDLGLTQRCS